MKGPLGIGGALFFGILIVLCALSVKNSIDTEQVGTVVVAQAPERNAIMTHDTDGDGVQDWEESLTERVYETIATPTSTYPIDPNEPYVPPTTLTGKFSEAFFKDYMEAKMNGADFSDPSAFVGTAVKAIEQNTRSKRHSRLELAIIPTSDESVRGYGNDVAKIILAHQTGGENEALILQQALQAHDKSILEKLDPIHDAYTGIIKDSLTIAVPDELADEHVDLVNAYEAILTDIESMRIAFDDPLYALARIRTYKEDANALLTAIQGILNVLKTRNVSYSNEESGAFFYFFDT